MTTEQREELAKLIDDPYHGLQINSNTNKTRMAIMALFDEVYDRDAREATTVFNEVVQKARNEGYAEGKAYWEPGEFHKEVWRQEGRRGALEGMRHFILGQESPCVCSTLVPCDCSIRINHNIMKRSILTHIDSLTK